MPKRKGAEGKDGVKVSKQEPTRRSERLSTKPTQPKPEVKPKKTAVKKEAAAKNKGAKGKEAGKEGTTPSENGDLLNEEVQRTELDGGEKALNS